MKHTLFVPASTFSNMRSILYYNNSYHIFNPGKLDANDTKTYETSHKGWRDVLP